SRRHVLDYLHHRLDHHPDLGHHLQDLLHLHLGLVRTFPMRRLALSILLLLGLAAPALPQSFPIQGATPVNPQAGSFSNGTQGVPIGAVPTTNGGWVQNWPDQTKQLFVDDFSTGTLNTINRWQTPTAGIGGTIASNSVGQTTLAGGTTANGFSALSTQLIFFDK